MSAAQAQTGRVPIQLDGILPRTQSSARCQPPENAHAIPPPMQNANSERVPHTAERTPNMVQHKAQKRGRTEYNPATIRDTRTSQVCLRRER